MSKTFFSDKTLRIGSQGQLLISAVQDFNIIWKSSKIPLGILELCLFVLLAEFTLQISFDVYVYVGLCICVHVYVSEISASPLFLNYKNGYFLGLKPTYSRNA